MRRILLVVEDPTLAELLAEALADAGHRSAAVEDFAQLDAAMSAGSYDVAIVDLDTRARNGEAAILRLRAAAPAIRVIALLPCGGLPAGRTIHYHLALEKPARLEAVLRAVG
jgi:DNA-binding response OmpR family regulator